MFTVIFTCYAAGYKVCNCIPWFSEVKDSNSKKTLKEFTRTAAHKTALLPTVELQLEIVTNCSENDQTPVKIELPCLSAKCIYNSHTAPAVCLFFSILYCSMSACVQISRF